MFSLLASGMESTEPTRSFLGSLAATRADGEVFYSQKSEAVDSGLRPLV